MATGAGRENEIKRHKGAKAQRHKAETERAYHEGTKGTKDGKKYGKIISHR